MPSLTQITSAFSNCDSSTSSRAFFIHGSKTVPPFLKWLAGKEKRSVDWLLWNVANEIVDEALKVNAGTIAIEDLKGIRTRIKCARKQRLIMHGWPFASLFAKMKHVGSKH